LAVQAWKCEDEARKLSPDAYALYGRDDYCRCKLCLPTPRFGVNLVVGWGTTWREALASFRASQAIRVEAATSLPS